MRGKLATERNASLIEIYARQTEPFPIQEKEHTTINTIWTSLIADDYNKVRIDNLISYYDNKTEISDKL